MLEIHNLLLQDYLCWYTNIFLNRRPYGNHQSRVPLADNVKYSNLSGDTLLLVSEKATIFSS